MSPWSRRQWLKTLGTTLLSVGSGASAPRSSDAAGFGDEQDAPKGGASLRLADFQPRSMLHVPRTQVPRARYPTIDIHAHLGWTTRSEKGVAVGEEVTLLITPSQALAVMDRKNIRAMVNITGGTGRGLERSLQAFDRAAPGRFFTCTEPSYGQFLDPKYPQIQADAIVSAKRAGAKGLKVLKTLGLYLREGITTGPLVKVDDKRFDPTWEACAAGDMPVWIHTSDPEAFFLPVDRFNERYDELGNHPDWSFHGAGFPSHRELMEARDRVIARHPKTRFLGLHVGHDAENLAFVAESMDRFPNLAVELGARIGELGRQPRTARKFFEKYQDRILFGTDAVPPPDGDKYPQQVFKDELYEIYYRFLETEDEHFDYAPAPVPPQGRWCIYGLGLDDRILKKVYHDNAARLLRLSS